MPYIKQEKREDYEQEIQKIVKKLVNSDDGYNSAKGELNYIIYSIVLRYLDEKGMRYHRINDFVGGVLSCCQQELYRRLAAPYEDEAIKKNGDVKHD
jgi:hypothetical protein